MVKECPLLEKCKAASGIDCRNWKGKGMRDFTKCDFFRQLVFEKIDPYYIAWNHTEDNCHFRHLEKEYDKWLKKKGYR